MIYSATSKGPYKIPGYYDSDSKRLFGIIYRPDIWTTGTVYYLRSDDDYDVCIPTVFNGFYYKVNTPGISGVTEPTWTATGIITDGSVIWEPVAYNLMPPNQNITDSTWTSTDGVTLDTKSFTDNKTIVRIASVTAGLTSFTITNHTVKNNTEEDDVTLQFKVAAR